MKRHWRLVSSKMRAVSRSVDWLICADSTASTCCELVVDHTTTCCTGQWRRQDSVFPIEADAVGIAEMGEPLSLSFVLSAVPNGPIVVYRLLLSSSMWH